jgi:hypothetical protein
MTHRFLFLKVGLIPARNWYWWMLAVLALCLGVVEKKAWGMKREPQNRRMSNIECRRMVSLRSVYYIKVGVAVHPRLPCSVRWVRIIIEL